MGSRRSTGSIGRHRGESGETGSVAGYRGETGETGNVVGYQGGTGGNWEYWGMRGDPGGHQPALHGHRCRTGPHSGLPLWGALGGHWDHRGGTGSTVGGTGSTVGALGAPGGGHWEHCGGHWEHRGGTMGPPWRGTGSTVGGTVGAPVVSSSIGFGVPPVRAFTLVWGAHSGFVHPGFGVPPLGLTRAASAAAAAPGWGFRRGGPAPHHRWHGRAVPGSTGWHRASGTGASG